MDIIIREARASDYQDIALISKLDLGYEYPAELVQVKLEKVLRSGREKVFVAIVDGKTAGYIHAEDYDLLYYPQMKNILGLAVLLEFRNHGIGTRLLHEVENWALESGAYAVRLNSGMSRKAAHQFYRNRGYALEKEQLRFIKELEQEI